MAGKRTKKIIMWVVATPFLLLIAAYLLFAIAVVGPSTGFEEAIQKHEPSMKALEETLNRKPAKTRDAQEPASDDPDRRARQNIVQLFSVPATPTLAGFYLPAGLWAQTQIEARITKSPSESTMNFPLNGSWASAERWELESSISNHNTRYSSLAEDDPAVANGTLFTQLDELEEQWCGDWITTIDPDDTLPSFFFSNDSSLSMGIQWAALRAHAAGNHPRMREILVDYVEDIRRLKLLAGLDMYHPSYVSAAQFYLLLCEIRAVEDSDLLAAQQSIAEARLTEEEARALATRGVLRWTARMKDKRTIKPNENTLHFMTNGYYEKTSHALLQPLYKKTVERMAAMRLEGNDREARMQSRRLNRIVGFMNGIPPPDNEELFPSSYFRPPDPDIAGFFPYLSMSPVDIFNGDANRALMILAAMRYRMRNEGNWPSSREDLVPEYLPFEMPQREWTDWLVFQHPAADFTSGKGQEAGNAVQRALSMKKKVPSSKEELLSWTAEIGFNDADAVSFERFEARPILIWLSPSPRLPEALSGNRSSGQQREMELRDAAEDGPEYASMMLLWQSDPDHRRKIENILARDPRLTKSNDKATSP